MIKYSKTSPYGVTSLEGNYLSILNFRDLPSQKDDILFEIPKMYENRPDLLAYDLYNDTNLWWVFSVRNKTVLKDPIFDMTSGTKIFLPKLSTIKKYIGI